MGGSVSPTTAKTNANGRLSSLPTPTKSGYTFVGWYTLATSGVKVTTGTVFKYNARIFARWTQAKQQQYTVTFNPNYPSASASSSVTDSNGRLSSLPSPTRSGYTFDGWYTSPSGGSEVTSSRVFSGNTTLYAHWTAVNVCRVTYDAAGGTVSPQSSATDANGRLSSLPTPTRRGYTFSGWYTAKEGGDRITTGTVFTDSATVYAQWNNGSYTVTFNPNGGKVSPTSAQTQNGKLSSLPTPTWDGHTFNGWYTRSSGGSRITDSYTFPSNTTIYAQWVQVKAQPTPASGTDLKSGSLDMEKLSREEIVALLEDAPTQMPDEVFVTEPSCQAPFVAGQVRNEVLQAATKRLNALRRLAGLPNVTLDNALSQNAQYGAVIQGANGDLDHHPDRPEGMSDEFFNQAASAASSSNLSAGRTLIAAVDGLMHDNSGSNLTSLGHRRWQLNPTLGKVGFGYARTSGSYGTYVAEKVFDTSGEGCEYDFVAWPASGYFPQSQFGGNLPWSVTLDPEKYSVPRASDITVTLKRESDGHSWTFTGGESYSTDGSGKYFNVNTSNYGVSNCIIFRPDGVTQYDGLYTVTVTGLQTKAGEDVTFGYQVDFFDPTAAPTSAAAQIAAAASPWAREEVELAITASIVPDSLQSDFTALITRQEFCTLMVQLVSQASGQDITAYLTDRGLTVTDPFSDTDDSTVLSAYAMGIVKGTGATTFNPTGSITRQEAATMLTRTGRLLGVEASPGQEFSDKAQFGSWAAEGISYVSGLADAVSGKRVMEGTGGGAFSPLVTYSREQAILTALRLFRAD